jgi:hypothetical protein
LLLGLKEKHERVDDLESFFHVLNWVALQFVPNDLSPTRLGIFLYNWYDLSEYLQDGNHEGGVMKRQAIGFRSLAKEVRFHPPSLRKLVETLEITFAALYNGYDKEAAENWIRKYDAMSEDLKRAVGDLIQPTEDVKNHWRVENLAKPDWIAQQFNAALQSMVSSPVQGDVVDRSINPIVRIRPSEPQTGSKRKNPSESEASGGGGNRRQTRTMRSVAEE